MKKISELLLYAEQYRDNKPFQEKYRKSSLSSMMVLSGCSLKWDSIRNPSMQMRYGQITKQCNDEGSFWKRHINLPKRMPTHCGRNCPMWNSTLNRIPPVIRVWNALPIKPKGITALSNGSCSLKCSEHLPHPYQDYLRQVILIIAAYAEMKGAVCCRADYSPYKRAIMPYHLLLRFRAAPAGCPNYIALHKRVF